MIPFYKIFRKAILSAFLVISFNSAVKASYSLALSCPTAVTNPAATTGTRLVTFSKSFVASSGLAPYTFATSGVLPTGLTLTTAGLLHGTPTESGTLPITVTATDADSCTGTTYTLVISSGTFGVAAG